MFWEIAGAISIAINAISWLSSISETGKVPSTPPGTREDYNELVKAREYLTSEKNNIISKSGWYWSSAGSLEDIEGKLKQVNSAMSIWEESEKVKGLTEEARAQALTSLAQQESETIKAYQGSLRARGLKGAGEIYTPIANIRRQTAERRAEILRSASAQEAQERARVAGLSLQRESELAQERSQLFRQGLGLAGSVAYEFRPGGVFGGESPTEKMYREYIEGRRGEIIPTTRKIIPSVSEWTREAIPSGKIEYPGYRLRY